MYMSKRSAKDKEIIFQEEVIKRITCDKDVQFQWCLISQTIECDKAHYLPAYDVSHVFQILTSSFNEGDQQQSTHIFHPGHIHLVTCSRVNDHFTACASGSTFGLG